MPNNTVQSLIRQTKQLKTNWPVDPGQHMFHRVIVHLTNRSSVSHCSDRKWNKLTYNISKTVQSFNVYNMFLVLAGPNSTKRSEDVIYLKRAQIHRKKHSF